MNTPVRWNVAPIDKWQVEETEAACKEKDQRKKKTQRIIDVVTDQSESVITLKTKKHIGNDESINNFFVDIV